MARLESIEDTHTQILVNMRDMTNRLNAIEHRDSHYATPPTSISPSPSQARRLSSSPPPSLFSNILRLGGPTYTTENRTATLPRGWRMGLGMGPASSLTEEDESKSEVINQSIDRPISLVS